MKVLLLVNASASSVTPRVRVIVQEILESEHDVTVTETSRRGHASRLAQGAAADGYELVVAMGGDGTLNEVANGLAGTSTALGALPAGSTNVFARTLGFTNDPVVAAQELLVALRQPEKAIRRIGMGTANGRYFLFNAGVGFDAAVVAQVEKRGSLKRFAGHPLFVFATVATWMRHYDRRHPHFDLDISGRVVKGVYFAICLKTDPYTFLGNRPLHVAPETGFDTALSILALQTLSLATLLGVVSAAMMGRGGQRLGERRNVAFASGVASVRVQGRGPFPYQLDGDYLGEVEELELRFEPDVLLLVMPVR